MRYMLPEPKNKQQYLKDLKIGKAIKKNLLVQQAKNSKEYREFLADHYKQINQWWENFTDEKQNTM
jgi:hypothetical protein